MSINTYIYIMRIIYVHDDVDVSAYEYVNVYADGCVNVSIDWYMDMKIIMIIAIVYVYVYRYLYMHELENEKWLSRL